MVRFAPSTLLAPAPGETSRERRRRAAATRQQREETPRGVRRLSASGRLRGRQRRPTVTSRPHEGAGADGTGADGRPYHTRPDRDRRSRRRARSQPRLHVPSVAR
eukprot:SAG11_NODE_1760_length_4302_cov_1.941708_3_plen_105_part_00